MSEQLVAGPAGARLTRSPNTAIIKTAPQSFLYVISTSHSKTIVLFITA